MGVCGAVQREFAQKHLPDDPMFRLVSLFYEVVPGVLLKQGKVSVSFPLSHPGRSLPSCLLRISYVSCCSV